MNEWEEYRSSLDVGGSDSLGSISVEEDKLFGVWAQSKSGAFAEGFSQNMIMVLWAKDFTTDPRASNLESVLWANYLIAGRVDIASLKGNFVKGETKSSFDFGRAINPKNTKLLISEDVLLEVVIAEMHLEGED